MSADAAALLLIPDLGLLSASAAAGPPPPPPPPPGLPSLPDVQAGVYYVRSDGIDTADGQTRAWLTPARAAQAPAGSTVYFWGGETFPVQAITMPIGATFKSFGTGKAQLLSSASVVAIDLSTGSKLLGIDVRGDGKSYFGVRANNVQDWTVSGCKIGNFWSQDDTQGPGASILLQGDVSGGLIGDPSIDARPSFGAQAPSNIIGGDNELSFDDNGILCGFCTVQPGRPLRVLGNEILNMGGHSAYPTGPANSQIGFGIHAVVFGSDYFTDGPTPFTFDPVTAEPTNFNYLASGNYIHHIGWNLRTCGGPSGHEGEGDRLWSRRNEYAFIGPIPYPGQGCDWYTLDFDIGCTNCLGEEEYSRDGCGPGPGNFTGGQFWGPAVLRNCLTVNCGQFAEGSVALQGKGNAGSGTYYYSNTTIGPSVSDYATILLDVSFNNLNHILVASSIFQVGLGAIVYSADVPASAVISHNAYNGGAFYTWGGARLPDYASWKAAGGDQNGLVGDPQFVGGTGPAAWKLTAGSPCRGTGMTAAALAAASPFPLPKTDLFGNPYNPLVMGCASGS